MIDVRKAPLDSVLEIRPTRFGDERGFFSETWNQESWSKAGVDHLFVQDNHSRSNRGVLRGLHYQLPPKAQAKLVRVTRGSAFDVAVDIRHNSATFGKWFGLVLSAEEWNQLLIPEGFAHGLLALEDDTEVQYKVSETYSPDHERCIRHDDPLIGIDWPLPPEARILSAKDQAAYLLRNAEVF